MGDGDGDNLHYLMMHSRVSIHVDSQLLDDKAPFQSLPSFGSLSNCESGEHALGRNSGLPVP